MLKLTLGSLFDGSGGFPLGGLMSGITPVWASEIEPFPVRVTTKRLPFMKHYGDVTRMDGGTIEPVDIITFGSPCQDMSIAGKRNGLDGQRSGLFYETIRIIKEMRNATHGKYPRYIVWENVPGAFSSNRGEDFRCVLESICQVKDETASIPMPDKWQSAGLILGDHYSVCWRVLDAQYWGVPQRRKRIYLVADFGGQCAGKILFESEGLSGYSPQGFRAGQKASGSAETGAYKAGELCLNDQGGKRMGISKDVTGTLRAEDHGHPPCIMESAGFSTEHSAKSRSIGYEKEISPTLRAGVVPAAIALENHPADSRVGFSPDGNTQTLTSRMGTGGNNVPLLLKIRSGCEGGGKGALIQKDKSATLGTGNDQTLFEPKVYGFNSIRKVNNVGRFGYAAEVVKTLDTSGMSPTCNQGGMAVVNRNASNADCAPVYHSSKNSLHTSFTDEPAAETLVAVDYKDPPTVSEEPDYIVRRLTPTECARLQGFPDWWCDGLATEKPTDEELYFWYKVFEDWRKASNPNAKPKTSKQIRKWLQNPHSDSAEYKMWGNGVALPCVVFVLSGIVHYAQFQGE